MGEGEGAISNDEEEKREREREREMGPFVRTPVKIAGGRGSSEPDKAQKVRQSIEIYGVISENGWMDRSIYRQGGYWTGRGGQRGGRFAAFSSHSNAICVQLPI